MSVNFKNLAMVSAMALGIASYSGTAWSAAFEMDDVGVVIAVTAAVDNTIDVTTTPIAFGTIGVTSDAVDTASLVMNPTTSAVVDDIGAGLGINEAHIVSATNTGTAGTVTVANALPNSFIYAYYGTLVNLTDGAGPVLTLDSITDNLAVPGSYTAATSTQVAGRGSTNGTGDLVWGIGAAIGTQATATRYDTNTYTGSFTMILSY
jgi:hypothetical protein